jgi:hypothetical protein
MKKAEEAKVEAEWGVFQKRFGMNKMGGHPMFLQEPESPRCQACGKPTKFAAQFDSQLGNDVWLEEFGGDGIGYLYVCEDLCCDRGAAFLYQLD